MKKSKQYLKIVPRFDRRREERFPRSFFRLGLIVHLRVLFLHEPLLHEQAVDLIAEGRFLDLLHRAFDAGPLPKRQAVPHIFVDGEGVENIVEIRNVGQVAPLPERLSVAVLEHSDVDLVAFSQVSYRSDASETS